jgi:hypothetical protein
VGDFNGDGRPDLAAANEFSSDISVLLGNGDGSFQAATSLAAGARPLSVAVGDFNGDGKPDLAAANSGSDTVSVLLGNGNGSFQNAVNYTAGAEPLSVAMGDFNGDGKQDLATSNFFGTVSVLLGNGNGTFQAAAPYATGDQPFSVAVGDFNGDGKQDLATANSDSASVSVLPGNGDGSFQAAANFAVGSVPRSVAVGDFNGDGKQDLATANQSFSNTVSVLLNQPNRAPTDIALSNRTVAENQPAGTVVGTLSTTDPDPGDTFTCTLVSGPAGASGNAAFTIDGNRLKTAAPLDFEAQSLYFIHVRSTDACGLFTEQFFTINVADVNETPGGTVVGVVIDDGSGQRSMVRTLTLTFREAIPPAQLPAVLASLSLTRAGDGLVVGLRGTLDGTGKVLTLTFTGPSIVGTSLADGRYALSNGGTTVLGPDRLFRLFGDSTGDGKVDGADVAAFQAAYRSRKGMDNYRSFFDYNSDGLIDATDYYQFLRRNGTSV